MKQVIANYSFNTSAKTITLSDFTAVRLDRLQLIVDTTTNKILYNFADNSIATATVSTNVITLSTLQGGEANTDKLQIIYDALAGDPTYDSYREYAGLSAASLNADLLPSTDVSSYRAFSFTITAMATGGIITAQGSNDGTNWFTVQIFNLSSLSGGYSNNTTGVGTFMAPVNFRYLRIRQTGWTSGSTTGLAELYEEAPPIVQGAVGAAQVGTWTVQPGNTANTTPWLVSEKAAATGGYTPGKLVSASGTNATNVKSSAGTVGYLTLSNTNAAARYLKLYNKPSVPTVGTDTPVATFL